MSEFEASPGAGDLSAGALLRQAREAAGLHVSTLAAHLKVPVRKLEALEDDRHDLLPDAVFARALASSVCRTLKIDARPVLERLPRTPQPRLAQDRDGINAPFTPTGDGPRGSWLDQISRPVALTVVALLLGAVVLIVLPQREDIAFGTVTTPVGAEPAMPPGTTIVTTVPVEPAVDAASAAVAPLAAASMPATAATLPAPVAAAPAPAAAASAAVAAAAPASAPVVAGVAADGVVVFRTTTDRSWIQVTDARGNSVLRRLMEPGETAGANGVLPLTVTVGNTLATQVQVRGQPFNMGPVSRDNVARFEVK